MSLQYGVPLEVLVNKFSHTRFEPMGYTTNPDIRIAKSLVDYIFRWLGLSFITGYREATLGLPTNGSKSEASPVASIALPAAKTADKHGEKNGDKHGADSSASNGHGNGNGNGHSNADLLDRAGARMKAPAEGDSAQNRNDQFARFQMDAPSCDYCGSITVRNGNCYLCHTCGNSMGCS
jgi:ribonucleoside-diphosphate reductase alpha chain